MIIRPFVFLGSALLILIFGTLSQTAWAAEPPQNAQSSSGSAAAGGEPIVKIGRNMEELAKRLTDSSQDADPRVAQLKQQIVDQLDALLEQLQKQSQQQPSAGRSPSGGGGQQQGNRTPVETGSLPDRQSAGKRNEAEGPSRQSSQRVGKAAPQINLAQLLQVVKDVWGHLPEKERERLRQHSADQVVPGHDLAVEEYFRRLAAESSQEAAPQ